MVTGKLCGSLISVYIREDPVGDASTVGVPCLSIFAPTLSFITGFPVNQQHGEIYDVEVRQKVGESYRKEKHNKQSGEK